MKTLVPICLLVLFTGCATKIVDSTTATPPTKTWVWIIPVIPNNSIVVANNTGCVVRVLQDGAMIKDLEQGQICTIRTAVFKSPWQTTITVAAKIGMANRTFDLYRGSSQHWQVQRSHLTGAF